MRIKALYFIAFIALLSFPTRSTSQVEIPRSRVVRIERDLEREEEQLSRFMVSLNPLKLIAFGSPIFLNAYGHYAVTPQLVVGLGVQTPSPFRDDLSGIGLQPEAFYSLSDQPFSGVLFGLGASFDHLTGTESVSGTDSTFSYSDDVFSLRAFGGYNIDNIFEALKTTILIGGELNLSAETQSNLGYFSDKKGLVPYVSLRVGYTW